MPTYVYACPKCEHRFEVFHSMSDERPRRCPNCKARAKRVPAGGAGLLFKGSGFYITDYRSESYKSGAKKEDKGGGAAKSDAAKPKPDGGAAPKRSGSKDG
jgi:putative FmdB family regulatory protein